MVWNAANDRLAVPISAVPVVGIGTEHRSLMRQSSLENEESFGKEHRDDIFVDNENSYRVEAPLNEGNGNIRQNRSYESLNTITQTRPLRKRSLPLVFSIAAALAVLAYGVTSGRLFQQQSQESDRAFVCITGQLSRLELDNKIATVLEPLRSIGLEVDIALVLDSSISFTTNNQRVDEDYSHPVYETYDQAVHELEGYGYNVLTKDSYTQVADPVVPHAYLESLHHRSAFDDEKHLERAQNNVRMIESWSQCYVHMSQDVERMTQYQIAVRVREDTGFINAIDMSEALDNVKTNPTGLLSNGCRSSYGGHAMNDKWSIFSPAAAQAYFELPYHNLYSAEITGGMKNTETYFYWTYTNAGLEVVRYQPVLDVVKLVTDDEGRTRLWPQERKKLRKQCGIDVLQDDIPLECTSRWNADDSVMMVDSQSCWPNAKIDGWVKERAEDDE